MSLGRQGGLIIRRRNTRSLISVIGADGELLRGVIVKTDGWSKAEFMCHGYRRRSLS